ncbi:MAG: Xaa-Pro aminopeptidase [Candidatus Cloacimonadaceae bacterium]|nr:Xaa-Pro aminopeptidase [Candidatus Cloacimonadaceae bacterium]
MNPQITEPRRQKLADLLADGENVVLFAKPEANLEKFSQDNNFLYFTGLDYPELIYIAGKHNGKFNDMLLIERSSPDREVWDGKKLDADTARQISGIERISFKDDFYNVLSGMCPLARKIYSNLGAVHLAKPMSYPMYMLDPLRQRYPQIQIEEINNLIHTIRKVKTEWEVMQLQKAIDITGKGIMDVLENARAGMMEYELEAMLFYRMQRSGVKRWGFAPIVAAGVNAATLHYGKNNCMINASDAILLDVGASYNNYSADISRTFPIGEKFSPRQNEIYSLVLEVQKKAIEMVKPGVNLADLNKESRALLADALVHIKLIDNPDEVVKYYMHGIGHFLGMDTHDVGGREAILEAGNILTIEPGVYIPEENLGVRIEDDILVTDEGYCILSQYIPKEISELEEIRRISLS